VFGSIADGLEYRREAAFKYLSRLKGALNLLSALTFKCKRAVNCGEQFTPRLRLSLPSRTHIGIAGRPGGRVSSGIRLKQAAPRAQEEPHGVTGQGPCPDASQSGHFIQVVKETA